MSFWAGTDLVEKSLEEALHYSATPGMSVLNASLWGRQFQEHMLTKCAGVDDDTRASGWAIESG